MNHCPRHFLPLVAAAITVGIAAFAFAPSAPEGHSTFASAFPIAQAQFAH